MLDEWICKSDSQAPSLAFKIFRFDSPSSTCCRAPFPLSRAAVPFCSCQRAAASAPHSRIACARLQLVRKLEKLEFCLFETKDCWGASGTFLWGNLSYMCKLWSLFWISEISSFWLLADFRDSCDSQENDLLGNMVLYFIYIQNSSG